MIMPPRPIALGIDDDPRTMAERCLLAAALTGAQAVRLDGGGGAAPARETALATLRAWLEGSGPRPLAQPARRPSAPPRTTLAALPPRAVLIVPGLVAWSGTLPGFLARRRDVAAIAILDWPTAWDWPEYHPRAAVETIRGAMAAALTGSALVVTTDKAAAARIAAVRPPASPAPLVVVETRPSSLAGTSPASDATLSAIPYVVAAGPIDARSNAALLLLLWRDAIAMGMPMPKLVLAGSRGAQVEEIAPLLDWNLSLRPWIAEAPGLSAADLRSLLDNARALVAPDFAGPPITLMRDAASLGVPVIAARTPEAQALGLAGLLDPLGGPAWRAAIRAAAAVAPDERPQGPLPDWSAFGARLAAHAAALP